MDNLLASVVISTYAESRLAYALNAIDSVRRQNYRDHEVVLVVDHEGALVEEARRRATLPTRLVVNPRPGMANARNFGLAQARGDVVVFLDDDAIAEPDWLARLLTHYRDDRVIGVGGRSVPEWEGEPPRWLPEELYWVLGCTYRGHPSEGGDVRNLLGNNMSFRTSTLRALGGFTLGRARYWQITSGTAEETELCLRIRDVVPQARIIYEPHAMVRHLVPASRLRLGYLWQRALGEGVAKARLRRLHASNPAVLSHEVGYLRHLLFSFIPHTLRSRGAQSAHLAVAQISAVLFVIAATGTGYGWTLLKERLPHLAGRRDPSHASRLLREE